MNDDAINRIVLMLKDFNSREDLYKSVGEQIKLLLESHYIALAYSLKGDRDVVVIECVPAEKDLPKPYWLYPGEAAAAISYHNKEELAYHKEMVKELSDDDSCDAPSTDKFDA